MGKVDTSDSSFSIDHILDANVMMPDYHLPLALHHWTFLPAVHLLLGETASTGTLIPFRKSFGSSLSKAEVRSENSQHVLAPSWQKI